jgi:hypothetical protein
LHGRTGWFIFCAEFCTIRERRENIFQNLMKNIVVHFMHVLFSPQLSGALFPDTKFLMRRSAVMITSSRKIPKNA